jgi:DNA polymerase (family 10)
MDNRDIAIVFTRLATMLEIDGANPFRVRAYREAARVLGEMLEPAARLALEDLARLPGIGKDLAAKIRDVAETGSTAMFDEMKGKVPLEVVALTELQGMGPKRVKQLLERGIRNLQELETAARGGGLSGLPGFGDVLQRKILEAVERAAQSGDRMLLAVAWPVAEELLARLRAIPGVTQAEAAGSFRRRRETVGDLDLLVCGGAADAVMDALTRYERVGEVLARGETKSSVRLISGLQVDLRLVPEESFGAALLYFTGNKQHNIELRKIAIANGWSLSEYGIADEHEKILAGRTEEDVYRKLGLSWIPPELREARDEIDLARRNALPCLIELTDLRADLHMHSDRSDGRDTLETMVRAARDRGYAYCAVTEHSQSLAMAQGFDTERVRRSVAEIEAVRRAVPGFQVLHGLEVDILGDGQLDLDAEGLDLLDWVIVSLHSRLNQPREEMTARVVRAVSHPAVNVMGHPTARMLGRREPVEIDLEAVLDAAAAHGTWMEINAQPHRVDLNDKNARMAKERGVELVIDTDAHSVGELDAMRYGVFAARRAGLQKGDAMNTLEPSAFLARLADRRARARALSKPKVVKADVAKPKVAKAKVAKPKVAKPKVAKPGARRGNSSTPPRRTSSRRKKRS